MREPMRCIPAARLTAYERLEQACDGLDPETVERLIRIGRAVLEVKRGNFGAVYFRGKEVREAYQLHDRLLAAGDDSDA